MEELTSPEEMVAWASDHRQQGHRIGFVPTMGFLHRGHVSLMELLRPQCDVLVVSIYVNPLQFGPGEDLERYPRDEGGDLAKCAAAGVDAVFLPSELYPAGFGTRVEVSGLTQGLCGGSRPGHFSGVTTVVARLFGLTRCDLAAFGEKDFQQLAVIRRMTEDLALAVQIVPGPIVRDHDGLALSSRNVNLSDEQRARALSLHQSLFTLAETARRGDSVAELLGRARMSIRADRVDYLELVDASSLQPLAELDRPARALVAASYGGTRLIDNVDVGTQWT